MLERFSIHMTIHTTRTADSKATHTASSVEATPDASPSLSQSTFSEKLRNTFLGERLAPGVTVQFIDGPPQMHLLKTEANSTFAHVRSASEGMSKLLREHGQIIAPTPSKDAMRMLLISLVRLHDGDAAELKQTISEIKKLDLNKPSNPDWNKNIALKIAGIDAHLTISIKRKSFNISQAVSRNLSAEAKRNKNWFEVSIVRANQDESASVSLLRGAFSRRVAEWSSRSVPAALILLSYVGSSAQSALVSSIGILEPVVAGLACVALSEVLMRRLRYGHWLSKPPNNDSQKEALQSTSSVTN